MSIAAATAVVAPCVAAGDEDLPPKGTVDVKSFAVAGTSTPKIVARAVMDLPPKKVWAIVPDCAHDKEHMPRITGS